MKKINKEKKNQNLSGCKGVICAWFINSLEQNRPLDARVHGKAFMGDSCHQITRRGQEFLFPFYTNEKVLTLENWL